MIRRACQRCGRPVWLWWLTQRAVCPTSRLSSCAAIYTALFEPPAPDPLREVDLPPADVHVCADCRGHGFFFIRKDFETGAHEHQKCEACDGTGVRRDVHAARD